MNPEREILNFWYNRKGYLTVNNIKTGQNREIYMVAVRVENGKASECIQVEAQVSVSGSGDDVEKFVRKKFDEKQTINGMEKLISKYGLDSYRKVVVLGALPASRRKSLIKSFDDHGIESLDFSEVLRQSLNNLDGQVYHNNTVRTLQLVKFLMLSNPQTLSETVQDTMHSAQIERTIYLIVAGNPKMLSHKRFSRHIGKAIPEQFNPETLAEHLAEGYSRKSYNKLVKELLKKVPKQAKPRRRERLLSSFLR